MGAFGGHGLKSIEDQLGALVPPRWTGRSCAWRKSQFFAVRNGARKLSSKTAPTREMRTVRRSQSLRAGTSIGKVGTLDAGSLRVEGGATQEVNCVLEGKSVWRNGAAEALQLFRRKPCGGENAIERLSLATKPLPSAPVGPSHVARAHLETEWQESCRACFSRLVAGSSS